MSFGKGIPLASGFDFGAKSPLDSRYSVDTIEERDAHVTGNRAYEGMLVYVKENKTLYKYSNNTWDIVPTKEYIDEKLANIEIDGGQLGDFATKDDIPTKVSELENDLNFITENEVDEILKNVDLEGEDCWYVGEEQPENDELIWFNGNSSNQQTDFTYDNPIIREIFSAIQSLQKTVSKLQEDVEYIKIHGGGSGGGSNGDNTDKPGDTEDIKLSVFELEDGGYLLLEDGGYLLLEESEKNEGTEDVLDSLLLEDGNYLLLEDGTYLLLESAEINKNEEMTTLLLENGNRILLEDGSWLLLEDAIKNVSEAVLLLENGTKMLLESGASIRLEK